MSSANKNTFSSASSAPRNNSDNNSRDGSKNRSSNNYSSGSSNSQSSTPGGNPRDNSGGKDNTRQPHQGSGSNRGHGRREGNNRKPELLEPPSAEKERVFEAPPLGDDASSASAFKPKISFSTVIAAAAASSSAPPSQKYSTERLTTLSANQDPPTASSQTVVKQPGPTKEKQVRPKEGADAASGWPLEEQSLAVSASKDASLPPAALPKRFSLSAGQHQEQQEPQTQHQTMRQDEKHPQDAMHAPNDHPHRKDEEEAKNAEEEEEQLQKPTNNTALPRQHHSQYPSQPTYLPFHQHTRAQPRMRVTHSSGFPFTHNPSYYHTPMQPFVSHAPQLSGAGQAQMMPPMYASGPGGLQPFYPSNPRPPMMMMPPMFFPFPPPSQHSLSVFPPPPQPLSSTTPSAPHPPGLSSQMPTSESAPQKTVSLGGISGSDFFVPVAKKATPVRISLADGTPVDLRSSKHKRQEEVQIPGQTAAPPSCSSSASQPTEAVVATLDQSASRIGLGGTPANAQLKPSTDSTGVETTPAPPTKLAKEALVAEDGDDRAQKEAKGIQKQEPSLSADESADEDFSCSGSFTPTEDRDEDGEVDLEGEVTTGAEEVTDEEQEDTDGMEYWLQVGQKPLVYPQGILPFTPPSLLASVGDVDDVGKVSESQQNVAADDLPWWKYTRDFLLQFRQPCNKENAAIRTFLQGRIREGAIRRRRVAAEQRPTRSSTTTTSSDLNPSHKRRTAATTSSSHRHQQQAAVKLHKAEKAWKPPTQDELDEKERVVREARLILNKITRETFAKLLHVLLDDLGIVKSEERAEWILPDLITIFFDKAVDEPQFASMYAELCMEIVRAEMKARTAAQHPTTTTTTTLISSKNEEEQPEGGAGRKKRGPMASQGANLGAC